MTFDHDSVRLLAEALQALERGFDGLPASWLSSWGMQRKSWSHGCPLFPIMPTEW